MSRRGAVAFLTAGVVPALALGGAWFWGERTVDRATVDPPTAVAGASSTSTPAAPLFSLRRVPNYLATEAAAGLVGDAVAPLATVVGDQSCLAVMKDGRLVVDDHAAAPVLPASTTKLVTMATALDALGADYRFVTSAAGTVQGDTVVGDLYLIGGGDPVLVSDGYETLGKYREDAAGAVTQLGDLAQKLVDLGIRHVTGNVLGDETRYDDQRFLPGWTMQNVESRDAGPLSALLLNDANVVRDGVARKVDDPATSAAQRFLELLEERGVDVAGGAIRSPGPAQTAPIATIESPPLSAIAAEALLTSDNNTAEMVLKELAAVKAGYVGTSQGGIEIERQVLGGWGLALPDDHVLMDGSGLSADTRLSCGYLVSLLDHLGPSGPLYDGLPVACESGTLVMDDKNRAALEGTSACGKMRAKTGSLGDFGAKALAGYMPLSDGSTVSFAIIVNAGAGQAGDIARPIWVALSDALASVPPAPSPDQLAPGA